MSSDKRDAGVWFITGASSGLGLAVLKHVLDKGGRAVATLRKPEIISDLASKYPSAQLLIIKLDVTNSEDITSAFRAAQDTFGRIDVVYNNAGAATLVEIEGTPMDVARDMFEINFWGASNVSREAVRFFRDVNKPPGGRLLQASSMGGAAAAEGLGYYCASKYALEGFSESLAKELVPSWNIKIVILELGGFRTKIAVEIPTLPVHPSYAESDNLTQIREYFAGPMDNIAEAANGAKEIYRIAHDEDAHLHIPLGYDAIGRVGERLDSMKKDVEDSEKFSVNLK